jgi:hypothetical protein
LPFAYSVDRFEKYAPKGRDIILIILKSYARKLRANYNAFGQYAIEKILDGRSQGAMVSTLAAQVPTEN